MSIALLVRPGAVAAQNLDHAVPPVYPLAAKAAGIDGPVVLKCTITKEGKTQNVRAISGPTELLQAAIDAVSQWTYQPYRHLGRLVEVDTTITVNFKMGTGQKKDDEQAKAQAELAKQNQSAPPQSTATSEPQN
jgi:TonB family protein